VHQREFVARPRGSPGERVANDPLDTEGGVDALFGGDLVCGAAPQLPAFTGDERSFRVALVADRYVNPPPGGVDGIAAAARNPGTFLGTFVLSLKEPGFYYSFAYCLCVLLFGIGFFGVLVRRNFLTVLMSIELMLNAVNLNLVAFSRRLSDLTGQVFSIFVITIAAGEAAIGLALTISLFRQRRTLNVEEASSMRG